jgi:pimeloyl-ACP methyl ester carboxylesterase
MKYPTFYRTIQIDGLSFSTGRPARKTRRRFSCCTDFPLRRECSSLSSPGFPIAITLSRPITRASDTATGRTRKNSRTRSITIAEIMNHFTEALGLSRYTLYMQDYGGPVGFRMALAHPDRIEALIVQDAVAHNEGLGANWKTRRAFWADRAANESALRTNLLSLAATRTRHVGNDPNVERYDPDLWTDEFIFSTSPARPTFKATSSTTTAPTSTPTQMAGLDAREAAAPAGDLG